MSLTGVENKIKGNYGIYLKSVTPLPFGRQNTQELAVFNQQMYLYQKGVRGLVLTTEKAHNRTIIERKLNRENIPYDIREISDSKINVFFGDQRCIDVVRTFDSRLNMLTPEQDFMLGIMLGYDMPQQCKRYLKRRDQK